MRIYANPWFILFSIRYRNGGRDVFSCVAAHAAPDRIIDSSDGGPSSNTLRRVFKWRGRHGSPLALSDNWARHSFLSVDGAFASEVFDR